MKLILLTLFLVFNYASKAQDSEVGKLLEKYDYKMEDVIKVIDMSLNTYSYTSTVSTHSYSESTKTNVNDVRSYLFDAEKNKGEQFTLLTVSNNTPSKSDIKHFNRERNSSKQKRIDLKHEAFFIKSNNDTMAIVGFNIAKEDLPSKYAYMAHCTGFIYIDKKLERITNIEIKSNEAISLKIIHINELLIQLNLMYNEEYKQYYISSETTTMKLLMLGSLVDTKIEEVFSDFKFY